MEKPPRLLRITTVPQSLTLLLTGQFQFMKGQGFVVCTCSASGNEVKRILEEGATHVSIPFTRHITPFRDLICLVRLIFLIRRFRPHIVHTHTPKAGLLGMIASFLCRVPVRIHTVAGLPLMESVGMKKWLLRITEHVTYRCAIEVYPNSKGLMNFIQKQFPGSATKLRLIGKGSSNGIDTEYFQPTDVLHALARTLREKLDIPANAVVFSYLGRVVRDKGLVELVDAFEEMPSESWLLLIGPPEPDLDPLPERTLLKISSHPRIVSAGFQSEIRTWLLASDIFVFPSYREGFPNAVMQGACLERACIVSDINGCNEIIQNNDSGLVVPPRNRAALQVAMLSLYHQPELRERFGKEARRFVVNSFSRSFVWNELLATYRRLLSKQSA